MKSWARTENFNFEPLYNIIYVIFALLIASSLVIHLGGV